jgi:hypothetical protein
MTARHFDADDHEKTDAQGIDDRHQAFDLAPPAVAAE